MKKSVVILSMQNLEKLNSHKALSTFKRFFSTALADH